MHAGMCYPLPHLTLAFLTALNLFAGSGGTPSDNLYIRVSFQMACGTSQCDVHYAFVAVHLCLSAYAWQQKHC